MGQMIHSPYISVAVALPVPRAYTYAVPDHFRDACEPGMRVLVPFGKKRVTGYILSGRDENPGFTLKKILDVLDDHPMFPMSEIPFFQWIADYYMHPLGEVIRTALPAGLETHDVACVSITAEGRKALSRGGLTPGEEDVLTWIGDRDSCPLKQVCKNSRNPSIQSLIRRMEKQDLVVVSHVLKKDGAAARMETFIAFEKEPDPSARLSIKRKKIMDIVRRHPEISMTRLRELVPTAPALVKRLAEAGWVRIFQRRVFRDPLGDPVDPDTPPELTAEQAAAVSRVQRMPDRSFRTFLITGITGSGKTEVYLRLVRDVVDQGRKALVLVPEIALITQTERRFRARFGERVAVIHSSLSRGELLDQWRKILMGGVDIVIGARSAVFAPFEDIGLIIVDEEHDGSYKQETGLRYNARDLAVVRGKLGRCPVVLGSATPSVQSYQNVVTGRFEEIKLEHRINRRPLPAITLVDLKKYRDGRPMDRMITPELFKAIRQCLDKGEQALIFLNRRGFATFPVCRDCGKALSCKFCDVTMTLHQGRREYRCHLCGYARPSDTLCPECGSRKIRPLGFGTEKIENLLKEWFPDARIARMDQDTTARKGGTIRILKQIRNRTVDIVVGTQMLAKGHDFPAITLVGVICADLSLSLPDFRAGERTFQLLAQVAGRAGRGDLPGRVVMQTYNPDHFIIEAARKQDFLDFFHNETPFRKALMYPPFSRMIQLKLSGKTAEAVSARAEALARVIRDLANGEKDARDTVQILGPAEAPITRISSQYRWQILIKGPSAAVLGRIVRTALEHPDAALTSGIRLAVDVDPYFLM